ncbi:unnamed protein product [Mytilus coruscus]|uniref:DNA2/NAM7 helicase helicase domain-containing protein n=1 Tax=Mytilus coruscus TaxID=42192 RepID=A0A6J8B4N5_MYTCO|nr:unnamed protein product [Mytilus coruscus]
MIKLTDIDHWPSTEELGMDESQRTAFISALTMEFVLIQGPPGTGKSYIGLQNARTLLLNKDKWKMQLGCNHYGGSNEKHQCILIVCYTNHALDQFVEGIIKFIPEKELTDVIPAVITIIEEAAEVPETHIVTAINPTCEHLILIGDHKQLKPKPAVRELATRFSLSISLFERMINNKIPYTCLQRQLE